MPASRRRLLQWLGAAAVAGPAGAAHALPPRTLSFPRDFGAHPELRTEWWYITGHAMAGARELGFQLTFFRSRVDAAQSLRSRFAARQLIFAHAAVTDLAGGRLLHDQRIAREGFGLAEAATQDTDLRLDDPGYDGTAFAAGYRLERLARVSRAAKAARNSPSSARAAAMGE